MWVVHKEHLILLGIMSVAVVVHLFAFRNIKSDRFSYWLYTVIYVFQPISACITLRRWWKNVEIEGFEFSYLVIGYSDFNGFGKMRPLTILRQDWGAIECLVRSSMVPLTRINFIADNWKTECVCCIWALARSPPFPNRQCVSGNPPILGPEMTCRDRPYSNSNSNQTWTSLILTPRSGFPVNAHSERWPLSGWQTGKLLANPLTRHSLRSFKGIQS